MPLIPLIPLVVVILLLAAMLRSPRVKGWLGEHSVARALDKGLNRAEYRVLHDVTVPDGAGATQIDHVVLSRFGIFVIETKNYSGWIFGSERDAEWTQTLPRAKHRFQNPLRQNYRHVKALEAVTGLPAGVFHSMVVFTGDATFEAAIPEGVYRLKQLVAGIHVQNEEVLGRDALGAALVAIESTRLRPGAETRREHIEGLLGQYGNKVASNVGKSVERGVAKGVRSGVIFLGTKLLLVGAMVALVILLSWMFTKIVSSATNPLTRSTATQVESLKASPSHSQSPSIIRSQGGQVSQPTAPVKESPVDTANLRCGYSVDTERCACYTTKGMKAEIEFEQCKQLAKRGTN